MEEGIGQIYRLRQKCSFTLCGSNLVVYDQNYFHSGQKPPTTQKDWLSAACQATVSVWGLQR